MLFFLTSIATTESTRNQIIEQALAQLAEGHSDALSALYEHTRAAIYGYILSILKNTHDAEDALQDCYLAAARAASQYQPQGKPMAWLTTIARNRCLQTIRERQKADTLPPEDWALLPAGEDGPDAEDRIVLRGCMQRLSDEEREIVVLHVLGGMRHREIAAAMQLPLSTVLSKYHRALKKLKKYIEKESQE